MNKKNIGILLLLLLIIGGIIIIAGRLRVFPVPSQPAAVIYSPVTIPFTPYQAWDFDGASPQTPSVGAYNFGTGASTNYKVRTTGGTVGKYITLDETHKGFKVGKMPTTGSGFTAEWLWRPGWVTTGNVFVASDDSFLVKTSFQVNTGDTTNPSLIFAAKVNGSLETLTVPLDGTGPRSYDWWNAKMHSVVFTVGNGEMRVYVDGTSPAGFNKSISGSVTLSGADIYFSARNDGSTDYQQFMTRGDFDQIAFYNAVMPGNLAAEHAKNAFVDHVAYASTTNLTTTPDPEAIDAPRDMRQYLPGAIFTGSYTTYSGSVPTPIQQYINAPIPRYKAGHNMYPIPVGNNLEYMAHNNANDFMGDVDNSPDGYRLNLAKAMNLELAQNWNHFLFVGRFTSGISGTNAGEIDDALVNPKEFMYQFIKQANDHPELPTSVVTAHAQVGRSLNGENPPVCNGGPCIDYGGFSPDHYLRTGTGSTGTAMNNGGGTYDPSCNCPVRRPVMDTNINSYKPDGDRVAKAFAKLVTALPNRDPEKKLWFVHEDGEEAHLIIERAAVKDPDVMAKVQAMFGNTTTASIFKYLGRDYANYENKSYINPIMATPGLQNTGFSIFRVDGLPATDGDFIQFDYSEARNVMRPADGKLRPMPRVYPIRPSFMLNQVAQYSGMWYAKKAVVNQVNNGDSYMLANTSNGWSSKEHENITPGSYLGMLKNLTNMGSESIVAFYFWITGNTVSEPATHGYIEMLPSYAQAPISYVENLYKNSYLIGDEPTASLFGTWDTTNTASMLTDSPQKQVVVRKSNTDNQYIISGSLVSYDDKNRVGAVRDSAPVTFKIGGQEIKVQISPEGNYYYYNNNNTSAPIFYALDDWHENANPHYWDKGFKFQAERVDGGTPTRVTQGPGVATRDFTDGNYATFASLPSGSTTTYNFKPRNSNGSTAPINYYFWYKAKNNGASGSVTSQVQIDGGAPVTLSATTQNTWCNKDASGATIMLSASQNQAHTLNFISQNPNFYADEFYLSTSSATNLGSCGVVVPPPNVLPSVSIVSPAGSGPVGSNTVSLSGTASDSDGTIASVTWTNTVNGTVSSSGTATGTTNWTIPSITLQPGLNTVSVKAIDNMGGEGIAVINFTYTPETNGPTVVMTAPPEGTVSGVITVSATATDPSGVSHVEFYSKAGSATAVLVPGTSSNSGSTYSISWNTDTLATPNGQYTLSAKAYDALGNMGTSGNLNITINNQVTPLPDTTAPTVSFSAPAADSVINGITALSATAVDGGTNATGISMVKFLYKANAASTWTVLGNGVGSGSTYTYDFNTVGKSDGIYNLRVEAYDGATPNHNMSFAERSVTINNTSLQPDMVVQDIQWTPSNPSQGQAITLKALVKNNGTGATPTGTITGVRFTVNNVAVSMSDNYTSSIGPGQTVLLTANTGVNSGLWTPPGTGSYAVEAWVNDLNRYSEVSSLNNKLTKTVVVGSTPSITWVTPNDGDHVIRGVEIPLTVIGTPGVTRVGFFKGIGSEVCSTSSGPSFTCMWTPSLITIPGSRITWIAKAYDSTGAEVDSKTIKLIRD